MLSFSDRPSALIALPPDTRAQRRRRFAYAGALVVHLIVLALFTLFVKLLPPSKATERSAPTEIVTITHRTSRSTAVAAASVVSPARRPIVHPAPVAAPRAPVPVATSAPPPVPKTVAVRPISRRAVVPVRHPPRPLPAPQAPHRAAVPSTATGATKATLSQAKIDAITNDLAENIRADRDAIDPTKVRPSTPAPMKEYGPATDAFSLGDTRNHHGLCDPIKSWDSDGYDYYYVACNVRFSDGTMQRQNVPWPVRFDPNDDPFSGTSGHDLPLAVPLPGWHIAAGETVSPELREYAKDHGVSI